MSATGNDDQVIRFERARLTYNAMMKSIRECMRYSLTRFDGCWCEECMEGKHKAVALAYRRVIDRERQSRS